LSFLCHTNFIKIATTTKKTIRKRNNPENENDAVYVSSKTIKKTTEPHGQHLDDAINVSVFFIFYDAINVSVFFVFEFQFFFQLIIVFVNEPKTNTPFSKISNRLQPKNTLLVYI